VKAEFKRSSDDLDPVGRNPEIDLLEPQFQLLLVVDKELDARFRIIGIDEGAH
jgi:hypothetical protein